MMLTKLRQWFDERLPECVVSPGNERALQLAAAVLLLEIVYADAEQDASEYAQVMRALTEVFTLNQEAVKSLLEMAESAQREAVSLHAFVRLLNEEISYENKFFLLEQMWCVAFVDGHIDRYEDYTIRKIADLLYIPHRDFIQTKHRAQEKFNLLQDEAQKN